MQYTKNFGSTAYLRLYGYTFYSDWFLNGPYSTSFCNFVCPDAPDYELNTHTRGFSAEFQDQINPQNLFSVEGSYTSANIVRDNNGFYGVNGNEAVLVNANNPYGGYCFAPYGSASGVVNCHDNTIALGPGYSVSSPVGSCAIPGKPQFGNACTYMIAENGLAGTYSGTVPTFYSAAITDQYRPTDKWLINAGIRLDSYGFVGQNTLVPPLGGSAAARAFWFNAYNLDNCVNNQTGAPSENPSPGQTVSVGFARGQRPKRSVAVLYLQYLPATHQRYVHIESQRRISLLLRAVYGSPKHRVRTVQHAPRRFGRLYRVALLSLRTQHARLSDSAADLDQLRPLLGTSL